MISQLYNNATVLVTNFVEQAKAYDPDLYRSVDLSNLSWLEQQWAAWYSYWGNPIIATGIMSFVMHEVNTRHHHHRLFLPLLRNLTRLVVTLCVSLSTLAGVCRGWRSTGLDGSGNTRFRT